MASFFSLVLLASIIWFIISLKKDKKSIGKISRRTWCILIISLISFAIVGNSKPVSNKKIAQVSTQTTSSKKESLDISSSSKKESSSSSQPNYSNNSESSNSVSTSQKKKYNFSKVEYGMTMEEVIGAVGEQPTSKEKYALYYDTDEFDFNDDNLIGSSVQSVQSRIDSKLHAEQESAKTEQENKNQLKSQAHYFGTRSVEYIQKNPAVYSSVQIENGMRYVYLVKKNSYLVRIDTNDGYTKVYSYDGNNENQLGDTLYTGRTIFNQPATKNYYYIGK